MSVKTRIILCLYIVKLLSASTLNNAELYEKNNSLQKRDVDVCLRDYGGKIRWRGQDRVADLGCGGGGTTAGALRTFLPSDFTKLVGFDVSATMIQYARANHGDAKTTFCELDLGAPLPHNLRDSFDHAFSFHAIHWVRNQKGVFTNIYDMLAPGGDCLLMFMARHPLVDGMRVVAANPVWHPYLRVPDLRFFVYHDSQDPEAEVKTLMESTGFKDVKVERKVMKYTYENRDQYKGALLAVSPFGIPDELRENYTSAHEQALFDLRLPSYQLEERAEGQRRLHLEYGIIIASGSK